MIEKDSLTWLHVKKHAEDKIIQLREENEGDLSLEETAKIRGRILELKELLDLVSVTEQVTVERTDYLS